jgi:hypothetical protein
MSTNQLMNILTMASLGMALASNALAGASSGPVTALLVHEPSVVMFEAGPHTAKPACSTVGNQWALSLNSPAGKAMYALLLMAQATGKQVAVQGSGGCTSWGDRETPTYLYLVN